MSNFGSINQRSKCQFFWTRRTWRDWKLSESNYEQVRKKCSFKLFWIGFATDAFKSNNMLFGFPPWFQWAIWIHNQKVDEHNKLLCLFKHGLLCNWLDVYLEGHFTNSSTCSRVIGPL
jgi:hypothetical protein